MQSGTPSRKSSTVQPQANSLKVVCTPNVSISITKATASQLKRHSEFLEEQMNETNNVVVEALRRETVVKNLLEQEAKKPTQDRSSLLTIWGRDLEDIPQSPTSASQTDKAIENKGTCAEPQAVTQVTENTVSSNNNSPVISAISSEPKVVTLHLKGNSLFAIRARRDRISTSASSNSSLTSGASVSPPASPPSLSTPTN